MTEVSTACSFIVRVYRIDTDDPAHITGQVESLDGSGKRLPFTTLDELSEALHKGSDRRKSRRGGSASGSRNTQ